MQPLIHNLRGVLDRMLQRTFPNDRRTPSKVAEHRGMACVSGDISLEFLLPIICVFLWSSGVPAAIVPVPEATVNEYHGPVFREDQIGRAWQISYVKPVPESPGEQKGAKHSFRPSIFVANARHYAAALRGGRDAHGRECIAVGYGVIL
jgi:hypothetical protein